VPDEEQNSAIPHPEVALFWEYDSARGRLSIAIRAPMKYMQNFGSPSEVMMRFLEALEAGGVELMDTQTVRARTDTVQQTFLVRWTGDVLAGGTSISRNMRRLTDNLGVQAYGDSS
jgi:hypothetical protein